jgi:transposase
MDFCYFVGIDIAKDTAPADRLDWAVYTQQHGILLSTHTGNTLKGIKEALTQLKALPGWNSAQAVFCMEHTAQAALRTLQRPSVRITL